MLVQRKVECRKTPDKVQYESEVQAAAYAELWQLTRGGAGAQWVYECRVADGGCGRYHLTRQNPSKRRPKSGSERRRRRAGRMMIATWEGEGGSYAE